MIVSPPLQEPTKLLSLIDRLSTTGGQGNLFPILQNLNLSDDDVFSGETRRSPSPEAL